MIEALKDYWYLLLILVALVGLLIFVMAKASKAAKKRSEIMKQQRENMERFRYIYDKYKDMDKELAFAADAKELAEGVFHVN